MLSAGKAFHEALSFMTLMHLSTLALKGEVTDGESEGQTFADGELVYIEVEVKRVSSAVGATVDLEYVVLELIYDGGGDE